MLTLLRWYCAGVIGPFGEAQRSFMQLSAWSSKGLDFGKLFPEHDRMADSDVEMTEEQIRDMKANEWMDQWSKSMGGS